MHQTEIRSEIVDRVLARRQRFHLFDTLDPSRTALVVIDMQAAFVEPGAPAEVPAARGIIGNLNDLTARLRPLGVRIVWVTHASNQVAGGSDWTMFFDHFVADAVRQRTIESMAPGTPSQAVWPGLHVAAGDLRISKNRYSALTAGSSPLERILRSLGIDTVLIAGTKTNICCESTGRDAMMLDFKTVMVSDCLAALSDDEHRMALENFIQQFGDVMTSAEALAALLAQSNLPPAAA